MDVLSENLTHVILIFRKLGKDYSSRVSRVEFIEAIAALRLEGLSAHVCDAVYERLSESQPGRPLALVDLNGCVAITKAVARPDAFARAVSAQR